jgi:dTDP-4-dehydrorhamnose 3,5-epimerase-like enzyme
MMPNFFRPTLVKNFSFIDERGGLYEVCEGAFDGVVNIKASISHKGVIRGLHYQAEPQSQEKIVKVIRGAVQDVGLNILTGEIYEVELVEGGNAICWPNNYAHGFQVLSNEAIVVYVSLGGYSKECERAINPISIEVQSTFRWKLREWTLSEKDGQAMSFLDLDLPLSKYYKYSDEMSDWLTI